MNTRCSHSDVFDQKTSDIDELLDMQHIANCAQCAELLDGHRNLAMALRTTPRNAPSIHFEKELRSRLQAEKQIDAQLRLQTIVLRSYWVVATIVSFVILLFVPWPSQLGSTPIVASLGVFVVLVAVVPAMIYYTFGIGRRFI